MAMQHLDDVRAIMDQFAVETGLAGQPQPPRRYLWTDAFAVCNFLELFRHTGEQRYLDDARRLVEQVHVVLGQFADKDPRRGWISGLEQQAGVEHPTCGGLRIGKPLPERGPDERFDERLEWDRDGQYFHYLTKWMQALARIAAVADAPHYQRWALELARAAHAGFTYATPAGGPKRMHWKMSVDLSRPLVASMGHHDPLDALLTYLELKASSRRFDGAAGDMSLDDEIADCQAMCAGKAWATDDPLGTGGLLCDALRIARLRLLGESCAPLELRRLLPDCVAGLAAFELSGTLAYPAGRRLAFRELGLATGLHALDRLRELTQAHPDTFSVLECKQLAGLMRYSHLAGLVERFWLQRAHRQVQAWQAHPDINAVMLATSLAPESFLVIPGNQQLMREQ
jgi:hypothetical protein